jgi:hypothetical protein
VDSTTRYEAALGDFSATPRLLAITAFAIVIGAIGACVALALTQLIALNRSVESTNLDAEQRRERVLGARITSPFARARKTA